MNAFVIAALSDIEIAFFAVIIVSALWVLTWCLVKGVTVKQTNARESRISGARKAARDRRAAITPHRASCDLSDCHSVCGVDAKRVKR